MEVPSSVSGPVDALVKGFTEAGYLAIRIPGGLAEAVGGLLGLNDSAGSAVGPIGIAEETGRQLQAPLVNQLIFVGILSVNLAVLNVLPFPPLDGGRIAVVLIEAVRRRKLPAEREATDLPDRLHGPDRARDPDLDPGRAAPHRGIAGPRSSPGPRWRGSGADCYTSRRFRERLRAESILTE